MTWKPDIFIYHAPCDDGFGAAWAVHQRWGDQVEYLAATYGKPAPTPEQVKGKRVLIGDFSFKRPVLEQLGSIARSIVVLDHHKTAQEDLGGFPDPAFADKAFDVGLDGALPVWAQFDMNKSGARLVWEFCHPGEPVPQLIQYVEDRDLWRFALPSSRGVSLWLRSHPYDFKTWTSIANQLEADGQRNAVMLQASAIETFYDQKVIEMCREVQYARIDGHSVPVVNCSWAFASDVAHQLLNMAPDAPFAACYYDRADGARTYSLRSEDNRVDVSAIAKRYGGGGHRNASGFEVPRP